MNRSRLRLFSLLLVWASLTIPQMDVIAQERPVAFVGATVHTVTQGVIARGVVLVEGGKFAAVGPMGSVLIPANAQVRDVSGRVIIPGLVDTHSHVGIIPRAPDGDGNEATGPVQSQARAKDAIWPGDPGFRMAAAGGVTTLNIMPGSANVLGGQTAYVKNRGSTVEEMLIEEPGLTHGMKMANGENPKRVYGGRNTLPSTRMGIAAVQRNLFLKAQEYKKKQDEYASKKDTDKDAKEPDPQFDLDPVVEILERKRPVHFHSHRADDILTAMRLADEFGFRLVLHHVSEGYKVVDEIAQRKVPCSIIVVESPGGKHEAVNLTFQNGGLLEKAGVKVAIHTDDPIVESRFLLRAAALAVRDGMSPHGALKAVTQSAAEILDLGHRVGSIEPGKDADLVILSGDPFSVYTHVLETWVEGEKIFDRENPKDRVFATGGFQVSDRYPSVGDQP